MKKLITTIVVAAFSATIAFAHQGSGRLSEKLNLSDAQKTQWQEIERTFHQDNRAFFDQCHKTMQDFRAAREANDTAKLESLKPVVQANRAQMQQLREAEDQKLMSILDDQQKAQYQQLKSERQQRRHRRE